VSIPAHCSEQKNPPQIFVQGARRRRFAAMPHIAIGANKVKAFGLGTIAVVERLFGIKDDGSTKAQV
jgi:hypothetical protein